VQRSLQLCEAAYVLKFGRESADNIDKRESLTPYKVKTMTIGAISAAGLSQSVLSSSNSTQQQQILQTLQNSLSSGDVNGAQAAFAKLQKLSQSLATASGSSLSSNSPLAIDLTALGSALSSGDLPTAQSAFATVLSDLNQSTSPALTNEANTASQSLQLVNELLGTQSVNSSSSASDSTTSVLERVYGSPGSLNVSG